MATIKCPLCGRFSRFIRAFAAWRTYEWTIEVECGQCGREYIR